MLAFAPGCSQAGVVQATPETLKARLAAASPGDTIKLAPGTYRDLQIGPRKFSPALTIDAGEARIIEARLSGTEGVRLQGGTYLLGAISPSKDDKQRVLSSAIRMNKVRDISLSGATFIGPSAETAPQKLPFGEGYGVRIIGGHDVSVSDSQFEGFKSGMALTRLDGFRLTGNSFAGMRSDGLSVSLSRNGLIERNHCRDTKVRAEEHPDCIQMWSRPQAPPTSDIVIRANRIEGPTQGIGLHNHVRNGVDDGGFDRILIEDNEIRVSRANAINLQNARASTIRNNKVSTYPGARFRASIRSSGDTVTVCGNTVGEAVGKPGLKDKAC
ncbi:MAG: right-handed parallel beta-helix repeat-containing protein [Phenylobacterium sp.]|nr:right-handed parallel beta-helix repeat-containing protein [Phenylobacterium sp.]